MCECLRVLKKFNASMSATQRPRTGARIRFNRRMPMCAREGPAILTPANGTIDPLLARRPIFVFGAFRRAAIKG